VPKHLACANRSGFYEAALDRYKDAPKYGKCRFFAVFNGIDFLIKESAPSKTLKALLTIKFLFSRMILK
jgi:hypothetical protein